MGLVLILIPLINVILTILFIILFFRTRKKALELSKLKLAKSKEKAADKNELLLAIKTAADDLDEILKYPPETRQYLYETSETKQTPKHIEADILEVKIPKKETNL